MNEPIIVRVSLDRYDLMSNVKHTQVYVQIPDAARASWLLPAERYEGLKDRAWPEVLDVADEHYTRGWVVSDFVSAAAQQAAIEWLRDAANRDEMQAAFEEDRAKRDPVSRQLHAENERLKVRVAELEAAPTTVHRAEHPDSGIVLGHYGTGAAARKHCEETERRSWPTGSSLAFDWIEDDEDRVAELVVTAGQNEESTTGYIVTALELDSEYDPDGDE